MLRIYVQILTRWLPDFTLVETMKTFLNVLANMNSAIRQMPLMHSTSLYKFRTVLSKNKLEATECPVFNENLLYLFYGRPSYRVASNSGARTDVTYCPICFILKPACLSRIKRIYPFDTGAFDSGLFGPYVPKESTLSDYYSGCDFDMPRRIVDLFFGSNRAYYFGEVSSNFNAGIFDFELDSYYQLISSTGESCVDDRKSSIEIQLDYNISLNEKSVYAIVLPKASMEDPDVFDAINKEWKAIPITYNTFKGTAPSEYHGVIREQLSRFLEDEGYI